MSQEPGPTSPTNPYPQQPAPYQPQPPFQPAPIQPAPRQRGVGFWLLILGGIGLLACVGICVALGGLAVLSGGKATATPVVVGGAGGTSVAAGGGIGLNQTAKVKNWDVTVIGADRPGKDLVWSSFGNKSTAAGTWFVVAVQMKNTGNQNFGVNSHDFEIKTASGATLKVSDDIGSYSYSELKGGQRIGGQVPPGVVVTYYVPFDIAPDTTGMQFIFNQDSKPKFAVGNAAP